jgi:hypothetical protein
MLQHLDLYVNNISSADMENLVADRLGVNKFVLKVASWVGLRSGEARRNMLSPPAPPCWRSATSCWTSWALARRRDLAAAYLLPRAEAALRQELQRLTDAAKRALEGQGSSSGSRAL